MCGHPQYFENVNNLKLLVFNLTAQKLIPR